MSRMQPAGVSLAERPLFGLEALLRAKAEQFPTRSAIESPNRHSLSYRCLYQQLEYVVSCLGRFGLGRGDRVAVVLPNGPEMATAFISVAAGATCAPLNADYTASEFEFYLADLRAAAVIVQEGMNSPVRAVATKLQIPLLELRPDSGAAAGTFTLHGEDSDPLGDSAFAQGNDIALLLHTSGTTSRPKIVPLTQSNVGASAQNIVRSLSLTEHDRCLNVMPLFHIHGLIAGVLASLAAGGTVICTPAGATPEVLRWIDDLQPTWYTAVPTIHQAVLAMAERSPLRDGRSSLRLIRSSSAALPVRVLAHLARVFGVPIIEAYGMTEAAHQVASNPLPPGKIRPGTVGLAAGLEITILDEAGRSVPPGQQGEIAIRGPNVMGGYERNDAANDAAFVNGWFRTGDQGIVDDDGYVTITGRIKEIINRGGEKVSPREVDDVLMQHPAVRQAVTFASPHATLGEEVAAAVTLNDRSDASETEIRHFAAARLAPYKVPRRVVIVDSIPRGSTGKLQRIGLAEKLGIVGGDRLFVAPRDEVERSLAKLWQDVLNINEPVGAADDFFELGGNSLQAGRLFLEIEAQFQAKIPLTILWESASLETLAEAIRNYPAAPPAAPLVTLNPGGSQQPIFWVHEAGGEIYTMRNLAAHLGPEQPLYGFQARGVDGKQVPHSRIEDMASDYVKLMRGVQPLGPYLLGGHSLGGVVAYEMAQQLCAQGQDIRFLLLIDTPAPRHSFRAKVGGHVRRALRLGGMQGISHLLGQARLAGRRLRWKVRETASADRTRLAHTELRPSALMATAFSVARSRYVERPYAAGPVTLFRAADRGAPDLGWRRLVRARLEIHDVPGAHGSSLSEPHVQVVAEKLRLCLTRAQSPMKQGLLMHRNSAVTSRDGD
jgi:acyl-CoA synthetase (AMP-forming)/AMP-acid ligase II/thioesterase domain-containing protein/acyl carrier protein